MAIHYERGSLLDAKVDYICQQVNCQGRMASGIAKSIKERWPQVYESYMDCCLYNASHGGNSRSLLGVCQYVDVEPDMAVINMFAQEYYGYDGKRYTSYDGFWCCLGKIKETVPKGRKIGFPHKIGCGLGGANWNIIMAMIIEALEADYEVYIYRLED